MTDLVIICPVCGSRSGSADDIADGYCGACCRQTYGLVVEWDGAGLNVINLPLTLAHLDALGRTPVGAGICIAVPDDDDQVRTVVVVRLALPT